MKKLPVLTVFCPPVMPTAEMSGSLRTTSASATMRAFIDLNDASCADSAVPNTKPVSCWGKKPFGMITNSTTVVSTVSRNTHSVRNW